MSNNLSKMSKISKKRAIRNWKRLAGKAFIRYGEIEWPDPYEPISCIANDIYRKRIKKIFDHGEEIFIGRETLHEKVKNTIIYLDDYFRRRSLGL